MLVAATDPVALAAAIGAVLTSIGTFGALVRSWIKQAREEGARERADQAAIGVAAAKAGIEIMKGGYDAVQGVMVSLQRQIGVLEGKFAECDKDREAKDKVIREQGERIKVLEASQS